MQNMWACILKFEISLIKISLLILVPRKIVILDYVFFFFHQQFYIILCSFSFFRICSIPLILIIVCFPCCLQWPFSGEIGKKRQEREKERKGNPSAEVKEKAEKVKKRQEEREGNPFEKALPGFQEKTRNGARVTDNINMILHSTHVIFFLVQ